MCYNIAYIEKRAEKYAEHYSDILPDLDKKQLDLFTSLPTYYFLSGFVHPELPVVMEDSVGLYSWGLVPGWTKDMAYAKEIRKRTLNAVGETVFSKPSYRGSIQKKRCLLPVSGFFEWRDFQKKKYSYFIRPKKKDLFSLGCIYENWVDKSTGEIMNTFSIITTPANPMMEKIHNLKKRMPFILSGDAEKQWIDSSLKPDEIKKLIKPFDEKQMDAYTISTDANSPKKNRNVPEILDKVEYQELD